MEDIRIRGVPFLPSLIQEKKVGFDAPFVDQELH